MQISTLSRYGLRAIAEIVDADGQPLSAAEIAARQDVSKKYLDTILARLRSAGLIQSRQGPGGGYVLARDPAEITLLHIVRALEPRWPLTPCVEEPSVCTRSATCRTRPVWQELNAVIENTLIQTPLTRLARHPFSSRICRSPRKAHQPRARRKP